MFRAFLVDMLDLNNARPACVSVANHSIFPHHSFNVVSCRTELDIGWRLSACVRGLETKVIMSGPHSSNKVSCPVYKVLITCVGPRSQEQRTDIGHCCTTRFTTARALTMIQDTEEWRVAHLPRAL